MASTSKKIIVKSSDGETFEVDEAVALKLQPIKCMIEDDCADGEIPIPNVTGKILAKVLEYCNKHVDHKYGELSTEFEDWEADFVKVDQNTLFDLILAANFLEIKSLLDLTCKTGFLQPPTMASSTSKKVTLKSSDGVIFVVDEAVALKSQTIKNMIEDDCADGEIPIPGVTGSTLAKVLEFCTKHVDDKDDELPNKFKDWDANFAKVDQNTLFYLTLAANFLNIKSLLDLMCQTVADMIKGKSPEEIRKTFNIENDFTPEEEEEIRRENAWAFN
ncbi:hypothetical protein J1N35_003442 [Gossypium stocksii]|uniref:SKP1-like protein n=1 Tax=Gossypium stocksii TaxID=47602 RepID=A0A9D3WA88_9ROSI|nr:hypothetical protein J1N35_003442 [Gossypium stocksii]